MTSDISQLFSRDVFLKRQPHIRSRNSSKRSSVSSRAKRDLTIIPEEESSDGQRTTASLDLDVKAARRHANTLSLTFEIQRGDDYLLRSPPRPAPSPPSTSPSPPRTPTSPIVFTNEDIRPTTPKTAPAAPMSDCSSSPSSSSSGLPTPTSSDDESSFQTVRPLSIHKKSKSRCEEQPADDDAEAVWYAGEMRQFVTVVVPQRPTSFGSIRPDSIVGASSSARRDSMLSIDIPGTGGNPSAQLDPSYASLRHNRRSAVGIPNYPPPAPPSSSPSTTSSSPIKRTRSPSLALDRAPPRSSLPTDLVVSPYSDDWEISDAEDNDADDESCYSQPDEGLASPLEVIVEDVDSGETATAVFDPTSLYAIAEAPSEGEEEEEVPLFLKARGDGTPSPLPLSLPCTPIEEGSLEQEIWGGLEELWEEEEAEVSEEQQQTQGGVQLENHPDYDSDSDADITDGRVLAGDKMWESRPPSSLRTPSSNSTSTSSPTDERALRSRWSSSTLSSQHSLANNKKGKGAASKLRLYFSHRSSTGGASSSLKSPKSPGFAAFPPLSAVGGPITSFSVLPASPKSPASPSTSKSRYYYHYPRSPSSPLRSGPGATGSGKGVRRRGSSSGTSTCSCSSSSNSSEFSYASSSGGSEISAGTTSSSGLRRKPIPFALMYASASAASSQT